MKNLPDEEWLRSIENRLRSYTEKPDDEIWNKISENIHQRKQSSVTGWMDAAAIVLYIFIMLSPIANTFYKTSDSPKAIEKTDSNITGASLDQKKENNNFGLIAKTPTGPKKTKRPKHLRTSPRSLKQAPFENQENIDQSTFDQSSSPLAQHDTIPNKAINSLIANGYTVYDTALQDTIREKKLRPIETSRLKKDKEKKKRHRLNFYLAISPSMQFHKITPSANDGVVVTRIDNESVVSTERFGSSMEAGIQGEISNNLEYYGSMSYYKHHARIKYQFQSGVSAEHHAPSEYDINPQVSETLANYNSTLLGAHAGVMYTVKDFTLRHKVGAGLLYQKDLSALKTNTSIFQYQLFYRAEFNINPRASFFFQPFYMSSIAANQMNEVPFQLSPRRAGISFGVIYGL